MAKEKNSCKLQVPLKFDLNKDEFIYNMVLLSDDRTSLIKNALFYYLHEIELGKVRERHYPYGKINNSNLILTKENSRENTLEYKPIQDEYSEPSFEYEEEIVEEYYDEEDDDDNMDDLDI